MKREFKDLFLQGDYYSVVKEVKELLKNSPNDAELYYTLFLAENNDYSNMNFECLVNDDNYNKALGVANRRYRNDISSEYDLYKELDKYENERKLVRYAQLGNESKFYEIFEQADSSEININIDSDFFSNLDYCLCRSSNPTAIDLSILIVN